MACRRRIANDDLTIRGKRYSARYLLLHYAEVSWRFDPKEIQRLISLQRGSCVVIQHAAKLGSNFDYTAFADFSNKRFQTRNSQLFDIQGCHPNWHSVIARPSKVLEECKATGRVVIDTVTYGPLESLNNNDDDDNAGIESVESLLSSESFALANQVPDIAPSCSIPDITSRDLVQPNIGHIEVWTDGYTQGFRSAMATIARWGVVVDGQIPTSNSSNVGSSPNGYLENGNPSCLGASVSAWDGLFQLDPALVHIMYPEAFDLNSANDSTFAGDRCPDASGNEPWTCGPTFGF